MSNRDSREVLADLLKLSSGRSVRLVKEFLESKIIEEKDSLVMAGAEKVLQIQGRIQGWQDILDDLTPLPEAGKSRDAYS